MWYAVNGLISYGGGIMILGGIFVVESAFILGRSRLDLFAIARYIYQVSVV